MDGSISAASKLKQQMGKIVLPGVTKDALKAVERRPLPAFCSA